jgi:hypothetical protein
MRNAGGADRTPSTCHHAKIPAVTLSETLMVLLCMFDTSRSDFGAQLPLTLLAGMRRKPDTNGKANQRG